MNSKHIFFLAPAGRSAGLTTVSLGLVRAFDERGVRVGYFKPIAQSSDGDVVDPSVHFVRATTSLNVPDPIGFDEASDRLLTGGLDALLSEVMARFEQVASDSSVVFVEGLVPSAEDAHAVALNTEIARALDAEILLVARLGLRRPGALRQQLDLAARPFGGLENPRLAGCILNRIPGLDGESRAAVVAELKAECAEVRAGGLPLVAALPENRDLGVPRTVDIARSLGATIYHAGEMERRRVTTISLLARTVPNLLHVFEPGALLVTPVDRNDVIMAVALAAMKPLPLGGLVLTGGLTMDEGVMGLCKPALATGLPILLVETSSFETASALAHRNDEVPLDDLERIKWAMDFVVSHLEADWVDGLATTKIERRMSPAAFCHMLTRKAQAVPRRILLPEGHEPRTIASAVACVERGIARCVLIGDPDKIARQADGLGISLPAGLEIVDPALVRARYVGPLVEFRKAKKLSSESAADLLTDNVMLGTVMLALGEADGLVSGAVHSSANTIRPALQIIKTRPGTRVVSSIFFMCLPDQVLVYGDCAVNTDPDAEALADIAVQSAESAEQFGIPARVAMISYSTGESGSGADVDKVREATRLAREKRPGLLIDGPLQYDAAANADVAATKAPGSEVAGRATVFIFPDLNTGNTTYKAVQRSANVVSIGPMLQGLKRPVNDLSRGALVEDIIYTIALTAIQAEGNLPVQPEV